MARSEIKNILYLLITLLIILGGVLASTQITTIFSYRQFALSNEQELELYDKFHDPFTIQQDVLILGIESSEPYNSLQHFQQLNNSIREIGELDGVDTVHFLTTIAFPYQQGNELINKAFLPLDDKAVFYRRLAQLASFRDITRKFISPDKQSLCVYLFLSPTANKPEIVAEISKHINEKHHFIGYSHSRDKIESSLKNELIWITILGIIVMSSLFLIIYRSIRKLLFFFLLTAMSVCLFYLIVWITAVQLNILTAAIPLLIAVISVSDTIHVIEAYQYNNQNVYDKLGRALFFTSLTTGLSFAVFFITGATIIIQFAFLAILGISIAFLIARFFAPLLFFILTTVDQHKQHSCDRWNLNHKYSSFLVVGIIVLIGTMIFPLSKLNADHHLHQDLVEHSAISKANAFYFQHFDAPRKLEIFLHSDTSLFSPKIVSEIQQLENYLYETYGADQIESPVLAVRRFNRSRRGGSSEYFLVPENLDTIYLNRIRRQRNTIGLRTTLSKDEQIVRIVVGSEDFGSSTTLHKNEELMDFLNETLGDDVETYIGGPTTLNDRASLRITHLIYLSIMIAMCVLFVILSIAYRSLLIGFAGLCVNIFPLLVVTTMMWFFEVDLNLTNGMALSIILGIAVDDSIHFLSRYKMNLNNDVSTQEAIVKTFQSVIRPVTITTILLVSGFSVLYYSAIESNHENSLYFIFGLLAALIADVLFLPAILHLIQLRNNE